MKNFSKSTYLFLLGFILSVSTFSQVKLVDDKDYYNTLTGNWFLVSDNQLDSGFNLEIKSSLHSGVYEEKWTFDIGVRVFKSIAVRIWEEEEEMWKLYWFGPGITRISNSEKVDNIWYFLNETERDGKKILGRTSWEIQNNGDMHRHYEIMNQETNGWETKTLEVYRKK